MRTKQELQRSPPTDSFEMSSDRQGISAEAVPGSRPVNECCKKLHGMGCSECDKMITMPHLSSGGHVFHQVMISVVIPTEGVEQPVVATLAALVPGAAAGIVRDVVLVDRSQTGHHRAGSRCRRMQFPEVRRARAPRRSRQAPSKAGLPGCCSCFRARCWIRAGSTKPRSSFRTCR